MTVVSRAWPFSHTLLNMVRETLLIVGVIPLFDSGKLEKGIVKTLSFTFLHMEKSRGVRSGERTGQGTLLFRSRNRAAFHRVAVLPLNCSVLVHLLSEQLRLGINWVASEGNIW